MLWVWQAWYTSQYATCRSAAQTSGPPKTPIHSSNSPRPYTRSRTSGASSSASGATAGLEEVWYEVDDAIDRDPRENHEIPVHRVLADIHEALRGRLVKQDGLEHHGVYEVGQQMHRVQAEQHPHD